MKTLVSRYSAITFCFGYKRLKMMPVPVASKVTVVDEDRFSRIDNVFDLTHGVYGPEFMGFDTDDLTSRTKILKDGGHRIVRVV